MSKYGVIYSDPPWKYERPSFHVAGRAAGDASDRYDLMDLDALMAMRPQLDEWAADDCVLFMWATWPRLDWAIPLGQAWGFEYVTCGFVWVKTTNDYQPGQLLMSCPKLEDLTYMGLGFHARGNTEFCLLFKKGAPGIFADRSIRQLVFAPVREHSRKPDEVRQRIELAYPDKPRLEMFARERAPGWDVFGNQTDKFGAIQRA